VASSSPKDALELTRSYSASRKNVLDYVSKLIDSWKTDPSTGTFLIDYLAGGQDIGEDGFNEFHQQVSVFLQAATETTASLASWVIMLLSDNPEYWQRLKNEVEESGPLDTYDAIMSLGLLDAVVNESLRLYPPAWLIPRIARVDTAVGGRKIKAGTRVVVSPYVSQRMTEFFDQPDSFIPERWVARKETLPRGLFFPFGMGSRICIGERYGKLTAKIIILAALERGNFFQSKHSRFEIDNYSLLLNPSSEIEFGLASFS
jgi:cytochrome P450